MPPRKSNKDFVDEIFAKIKGDKAIESNPKKVGKMLLYDEDPQKEEARKIEELQKKALHDDPTMMNVALMKYIVEQNMPKKRQRKPYTEEQKEKARAVLAKNIENGKNKKKNKDANIEPEQKKEKPIINQKTPKTEEKITPPPTKAPPSSPIIEIEISKPDIKPAQVEVKAPQKVEKVEITKQLDIKPKKTLPRIPSKMSIGFKKPIID